MHIGVPLPQNPIEELEKNKKLNEQKSGQELYELRKREKELKKKGEKRKEALQQAPKKIGKYVLYLFIAAAIIGGFIWFITSRPKLPPITSQNHVEDIPQAHIMNVPIQDRVQRHMLEHSDGRGRPRIIVQYNCEDFECEPDLAEKLTETVKKYPAYVYLAPNDYDGKIILTAIGRREILDSFSEGAIRSFIEGTSSFVQELKMTSGNLFFRPNRVTLRKGQPVRIRFSNAGAHTFVIDELGVNASLRGSSPTVEFTPDKAGTFEYYCSVPGHREGGMLGSLTVE